MIQLTNNLLVHCNTSMDFLYPRSMQCFISQVNTETARATENVTSSHPLTSDTDLVSEYVISLVFVNKTYSLSSCSQKYTQGT